MEGEGFEPSKAEPTDLQSAPFDRSGTPPRKPGIIVSSPLGVKQLDAFFARASPRRAAPHRGCHSNGSNGRFLTCRQRPLNGAFTLCAAFCARSKKAATGGKCGGIIPRHAVGHPSGTKKAFLKQRPAREIPRSARVLQAVLSRLGRMRAQAPYSKLERH